MSNKPPIKSIVGGTRNELCAMPWDEYLAYPALNPSTIVHGRKSMLHLKHAWDNRGDDSDAMLFGRAQHCLLFEPREFERRYRPWEGRRAGNAYEEFCAEAYAEGAEVIKATGEYSQESAIEATHGFLAHPLIQRMIAAGKAEQSILCVENGMQCKGRLDWISASEHCISDLKTARDITARAFGRAFYTFGYDIKLGLYKRWLDAVTKDTWPVNVICLESKAPYDVAVVPVPDAVLESGVKRGMAIITRVKQCMERNEWPGVAGHELYPLDVPAWEMEDGDNDILNFTE